MIKKQYAGVYQWKTDCSMSNGNDRASKKIFKQAINYENGVLMPKIREISIWRDTNLKQYESGVITLGLLLPKELRSEVLEWWKHGTGFEDLTMDGKKSFDDLFVYILTMLEDRNICFPSLSFDVGHD